MTQLDGYDLVIRTPGLAPNKIITDGKVWSATNEFFAHCPAHIIGVTGSKGKGTTASLIASMLEAAGHTVWLVGNIGAPALDVLSQISADDIVVYELSSFQLWDLEQSPHTAVVLYIEQEHLDVHADMDDYVNAKANIARHQSSDDILIYNADNQHAQHIASLTTAQLVRAPSADTAHVMDDQFYYGEQKLCSVSALKLPGVHNVSNAIAAIDAVWQFTQDAAAIKAGLAAFSGLPHRLAYVATVNDVAYYDDSIATTPSSAIAAMRSFTTPKVLILGGSSKGSNFSTLATELLSHDVEVILIGEEASRLEAAFKQVGFAKYQPYIDHGMSEVVALAASLAQPGSVVLLSPAAASFGQFKNYADRGQQFCDAVKALAS